MFRATVFIFGHKCGVKGRILGFSFGLGRPRVLEFRFGVSNIEFGPWDLGLRVQGVWFGVQSFS